MTIATRIAGLTAGTLAGLAMAGAAVTGITPAPVAEAQPLDTDPITWCQYDVYKGTVSAFAYLTLPANADILPRSEGRVRAKLSNGRTLTGRLVTEDEDGYGYWDHKLHGKRVKSLKIKVDGAWRKCERT